MPAARRPARHLGALLAALGALVLLGGCTLPPPAGNAPLRYRDAIFPNVTATKDIQYGSAPGADGTPQALKLDLYRPTGDAQTRRPAVVWIHGGGFRGGDKTNNNVATLSRGFAQTGYVAISINYRLLATTRCSTDPNPVAACYDAALAAQHDAQAAIRWLRANAPTYGIDPTRIAVGGTSAGAVTSILVGANSGDVGDSGNPGYPSTVRAANVISGGIPDAPADLFDAGDAPTIFFQGTADPVVSQFWALANAGALYNAGVPVFYESLEGAGHVPFKEYGDQFLSQSLYFDYAMLDLSRAAGQPASAARAASAQESRLRKAHPALSRRFPRRHR